MYLAPGKGQTAPGDKIVMSTERPYHFTHLLHVSKKISLKSDFFFHDLIHVYSPGAGADSPRGQNCDVNRKALSLYPFVARFIKISLKSDFFFHDLIRVYSPGAGVRPAPRGQSVVTSVIYC